MEKTNILVSILIPVYNVECYIERCVESLFQQSYQNIEYVFVDDCSLDKSVDIIKHVLKKYPQREKYVKIITHEVNKGLSDARNTAFLNSSGTYIMHVDSDDYIDIYMVEKMLQAAIKDNADMVVCDFYCVYEHHEKRLNVKVPKDKMLYLSSLLTRRTTFNIWGRLIKRKILDKNNILSISGLYHGEDYATVPRIVFYSNSILKLNECLYYYLRSDEQVRTHFVDEKGIDDLLKANQILRDFFISKDMKEDLPLEESKAMNKINLFYSIPFSLYKKVALLYPELKIFSLEISFHYKILLLLSDLKCFRTLNCLIRFLSSIH